MNKNDISLKGLHYTQSEMMFHFWQHFCFFTEIIGTVQTRARKLSSYTKFKPQHFAPPQCINMKLKFHIIMKLNCIKAQQNASVTLLVIHRTCKPVACPPESLLSPDKLNSLSVKCRWRPGGGAAPRQETQRSEQRPGVSRGSPPKQNRKTTCVGSCLH